MDDLKAGYSRNSRYNHSRKRPASVKLRLKWDLKFVLKKNSFAIATTFGITQLDFSFVF